jgi:hypothetical protein
MNRKCIQEALLLSLVKNMELKPSNVKNAL